AKRATTSGRPNALSPGDSPAMRTLSRSDAEDLLYREARLLDEHCYQEWLAMLDENATYWIPCNGEGKDPNREISLVFDDRRRLPDRMVALHRDLGTAQMLPSQP